MGMCLFPEKSTTNFGRSPIFRRKLTIFIGRETKHTFYQRKSTYIKFATVSFFATHCSQTIINHSTTTTPQAQTGVRSLFCVTFRSSPVVDMSVHGDHGSGAAKRRRDRLLRVHWRHDQFTLQMVLAAVQHHSYSALRRQSTATRAGEWEREMNYTAKTRGDLPPHPPHLHHHTTPHPELLASARKSPAEGGQGRSRTLRRRRGSSRAPSCRSSMLQCRRVGTSWLKRSGTLICTSLSWLSKCPRSHLHPVVLAGARFLWCSRRRNSWWKCLRSHSSVHCTGLWSRTLTFQFLMVVTVVAEEEVCKVYAQDRIQLLHSRNRLVLRMRLFF